MKRINSTEIKIVSGGNGICTCLMSAATMNNPANNAAECRSNCCNSGATAYKFNDAHVSKDQTKAYTNCPSSCNIL
ncbi:MAG: hypothetical protein KKE11_02870 [Gammaproteobacteria bacterium]|nr:hypothetical protein [Gammaproteobacteria bacterium]